MFSSTVIRILLLLGYCLGTRSFVHSTRRQTKNPILSSVYNQKHDAPLIQRTKNLFKLSVPVTGTTQLRMVSDPDPSILISNKDDNIQKLAFFSAFVVLGLGTDACVQLWHGPAINWLGTEFYETIRSTIFPLAFGSIFTIVGILHFVFDTNFIRIVPPKGTWGGLWQVPAPGMDAFGITYEQYHCYWTGIAEFVGGAWLLLAATGLIPSSTELPAFLLFLLTIGVTPANLYMLTHDAHPGGAIPKLDYPFGHIARFIIQCGLLSNFWIMATN